MTESFEIHSIPLKEEPAIFEDYLHHYSRVGQFYSFDFRENLESCLQLRKQQYFLRKEIQPLILQQNKRWNAGSKTIDNIEKLCSQKTMAVVTGQQAGLFGGPLYTIYKSITTIKLAEKLEEQYPDYQFVPVFWLEVGDSDFAEINQFHLMNMKNEIDSYQLPDNPEDKKPVFRRKIPAEISGIFRELPDALPPSEFRDGLLNKLQELYKPGTTFSDAFARRLNELLGNQGLILFNPMAEEVQRLSAPLYKKALLRREELYSGYESVRNALQQNNYHRQIHLNEDQTLLFMETKDQQRQRLDFNGNNFRAGKGETLTQDDLLAEIEKNPGRFSPNVALRPVLQDFLLPTAAYVAGPSEISYAAQLKPVYEVLEVNMPVFFPRMRLTLLEGKIHRIMEKYNIGFEYLFQAPGELVDNFVHTESGRQVEELFAHMHHLLNNGLNGLRKELLDIDQTLKSGIDKTGKHMEQSLEKLRQKVDEAVKRRMDIQVQQVERVQNHFFPLKKPQERVFNPLYFTARYGPDFFERLSMAVELEVEEHLVVLI
ncbi:MAG: bacillithiol biosynthesis cysteine-adding enzyme BshC [Calditrichia bacterium]